MDFLKGRIHWGGFTRACHTMCSTQIFSACKWKILIRKGAAIMHKRPESSWFILDGFLRLSMVVPPSHSHQMEDTPTQLKAEATEVSSMVCDAHLPLLSLATCSDLGVLNAQLFTIFVQKDYAKDNHPESSSLAHISPKFAAANPPTCPQMIRPVYPCLHEHNIAAPPLPSDSTLWWKVVPFKYLNTGCNMSLAMLIFLLGLLLVLVMFWFQVALVLWGQPK